MTDWKRVSEYAIQREGQSIAKVTVDSKLHYELWDGEVMVAVLPSAEAAKKMADELRGME